MMSLKSFREHWKERPSPDLLAVSTSFLLVASEARTVPTEGPTVDDDQVDLFSNRANLEDTTRVLQGGRASASLHFDHTLVCPIEKRAGANDTIAPRG